jgi:hypothetical protein
MLYFPSSRIARSLPMVGTRPLSLALRTIQWPIRPSRCLTWFLSHFNLLAIPKSCDAIRSRQRRMWPAPPQRTDNLGSYMTHGHPSSNKKSMSKSSWTKWKRPSPRGVFMRTLSRVRDRIASTTTAFGRLNSVWGHGCSFPRELSTLCSLNRRGSAFSTGTFPNGTRVSLDLTRWKGSVRTKGRRAYILKKADILLYTTSLAGTEALSSVLKPDVIVLGEASRLTEPESWNILANYEPRAFILVGNYQQLKSIVQSDSWH